MPAAAHDAPCPASPRSKTVIWQPAAARRHPIPRPATPAPITATRGKARRQPVSSNTGQVWTAIRRATPSAGMIQVRFDGYDLSRHALAPTPQPDFNVVGARPAEGKLQEIASSRLSVHTAVNLGDSYKHVRGTFAAATSASRAQAGQAIRREGCRSCNRRLGAFGPVSRRSGAHPPAGYPPRRNSLIPASASAGANRSGEACRRAALPRQPKTRNGHGPQSRSRSRSATRKQRSAITAECILRALLGCHAVAGLDQAHRGRAVNRHGSGTPDRLSKGTPLRRGGRARAWSPRSRRRSGELAREAAWSGAWIRRGS